MISISRSHLSIHYLNKKRVTLNEECIDLTEIWSFACLPRCSSVQMQNEGSNGGHSCEQDLEKQGKSQEGLSGVGSGDEANQTLFTIVISNGETPEPNRIDNNDSKDACHVSQEWLLVKDKEEALIDLGCQCRGGLAKAHRSGIDTWFRIRGSNRCDICQGIAANVPPPESQPSLLVLKKRATVMANAKGKSLMQNELDAMLDVDHVVEPRPQGKLGSMRRRKFNLPGGPGGCSNQNETAAGVAEVVQMLDQVDNKHQSVTPSSSGCRKISCKTAGDAIVDATLEIAAA
ncbi:hypothetical protein Q3G72_029458 [Acer saccharum]|nr:hypothetical protein Q3G72_029458 [Acer saccharum]